MVCDKVEVFGQGSRQRQQRLARAQVFGNIKTTKAQTRLRINSEFPLCARPMCLFEVRAEVAGPARRAS